MQHLFGIEYSRVIFLDFMQGDGAVGIDVNYLFADGIIQCLVDNGIILYNRRLLLAGFL